MVTAIIVTIVIIAVLGGLVLSLLRSTKTGMPSRDVLDRAARRARQLDTHDGEDRR